MRYVRKIQFTGKSTFIVSLPKKWVLEHKLSTGSQVVIEENGPVLTIKPFSQIETKDQRIAPITIKGDEDPETVARRVIGAYIINYDKIVIKSQVSIPPAIRNTLRRTILNKLLGAEIINEDKQEIHIQVLLNSRNVTVEDALRRLTRVVNSVIEDTCSTLEKKDISLAQEVVKEDDSIDRIFFYITRLFNQVARGFIEVENEINFTDLLVFRSLAKLLERIGDHAINVAQNALNLMGTNIELKDIYNLCRDALGIFSNSVEAIMSRNPYIVDEVGFKTEILRKKEEQLFSFYLNKLQPDQLVSLRLILESIRRIAEYSRDISELALDLGLEKILKN
ncbi:MAG: PhoU domain-containing protein [Desulfurococcaceae archaeon]